MAKCQTQNTYFNQSISSLKCTVCPVLPNCIRCQSAMKCWICKSGYYRNIGAGNCLFCSSLFANCIQCTPTKCLKCKVGYTVYVQGAIQCTRCDSLVKLCLSCEVNNLATTCFECFAGYYPVKYCPYSPNCTYICVPCLSDCLTCSNRSTCIKCKSGYPAEYGCANYHACTQVNDSLPLNSSRCIECSFPNKLDSLGGCSHCYQGYYLANSYCSSTIGCMVAIKEGGQIRCVTCKFNEHFQMNPINQSCICFSGFELIDQSCKQICGDGISLVSECDDGSRFGNGDGCSE